MALGPKGEIVLSSLTMGALTYDGKQFLAALPAPLFTDPASMLQGETPDQRNTRLSWFPALSPDRFGGTDVGSDFYAAATTDGKIWLGTRDRALVPAGRAHLPGDKGFTPYESQLPSAAREL